MVNTGLARGSGPSGRSDMLVVRGGTGNACLGALCKLGSWLSLRECQPRRRPDADWFGCTTATMQSLRKLCRTSEARGDPCAAEDHPIVGTIKFLPSLLLSQKNHWQRTSGRRHCGMME